MNLEVAGSMPALVTPLRSARELDLPAFASLVEQALTDGASGVLVAGTTGEGPLLEEDQRFRLVRTAVEASGGGQVLACAWGATLDDVHRDVERATTAGAAAVLVSAPTYLPLTPEEIVDAHRAVADGSDVPTLVYHIPQLTGSWLTSDVVGELAAHPAIVGMKDSSPDAERRASFVAAGGDGFAVMTGHAPTLRAALEAGAAGSITAIANIRQRTVVALHEAVHDGKDDEAAHLQQALASCTTGLAAVTSSTPAVLKAALQLHGTIPERWCRPPLRSVPNAALDRVRTALLP